MNELRALNNYLLIRDGYVLIDIQFIDQSLYCQAFQEYDKSDETIIMQAIVAKALTIRYHRHLAYLESKNIIKLLEYGKRHNQSL